MCYHSQILGFGQWFDVCLFLASWGIRQGDPLSPFLFILMSEAFEKTIQRDVRKSNLRGLQPSSQATICSHHQFVDDTLLMGESLIKEANTIKAILDTYEKGSGKKVSLSKSSIFFMNTSENRKMKIANILGCKMGVLPYSYLGLPLCVGPTSDSFWSSLIDRFQMKLAGWKGALLSQAGKLQLIKASLQNLPVYAMSLFKILAKFADRMKVYKRNCFGQVLNPRVGFICSPGIRFVCLEIEEAWISDI